jgi:hypothetical protein
MQNTWLVFLGANKQAFFTSSFKGIAFLDKLWILKIFLPCSSSPLIISNLMESSQQHPCHSLSSVLT